MPILLEACFRSSCVTLKSATPGIASMSSVSRTPLNTVGAWLESGFIQSLGGTRQIEIEILDVGRVAGAAGRDRAGRRGLNAARQCLYQLRLGGADHQHPALGRLRGELQGHAKSAACQHKVPVWRNRWSQPPEIVDLCLIDFYHPPMVNLTIQDFEAARARIAEHIKWTPLLTSRQLSEMTGYDARLKAECFQRIGAYKIRGPLNKFAQMPEEQKRRGVVCASAGNHAQGVALAAKIHGIRAVVCMAANATPAKIAATRSYGAEVVLHGSIFDEANEKAKELAQSEGLTFVHPFDDEQLVAGQGTLGLEVVRDWPDLDAIVVPIGGGGLISGVSMAVKSHNPKIKVIGVESSDGPAMQASVKAGALQTIECNTIIDGLRVRTVGTLNFSVVQRYVDDIVTLSDKEIFEAMLWTWERCKLVCEGAAAAPVGALMQGLIKLPPGSKVAAVISGGNVNLDQLRGLRWN